MRVFFSLIFTLLTGYCQIAAQSFTYTDLVNRLIDMEHLAVSPLNGEKAGQWSSYERLSRFDETTNTYIDWSANNDGGGFIREEGDEQVLAEMKGPGCIWRIWSARPESGHVKIYIDGLSEPAVDLPFSKYFDRSEEPFVYPSLVHTTARGQNSYIPVSYQKSCKIVAEKGWGRYYYFTYSSFPENARVPSFRRNLSAAEKKALEKLDLYLSKNLGTPPGGSRKNEKSKTVSHNVIPGSTKTILDLKGKGAITSIRVQMALPSSVDGQREMLRKLTLKIFWDGKKDPAVWAPLGDFFGTAPGANLYTSLPLGMDENGFYCFWFMPYANGAHIELANEGKKECDVTFKIIYSPLKKLESGYLRFHAKWHRDYLLPDDPERWPDWTLLKTTGTGRYCGVMLHIWNPRGGWWGEGDEKFFIDSEKFPSVFGTGSEDYFGYAWSNPGLFTNAFHNQTISMENKGHISVNRWHIADNVPFQHSFEGYIEKYYSNERPTLYSAMVYWYLEPDGLDPYILGPAVERTEYWVSTPSDFIKDALEGEKMKVISVTSGSASIQDMDGRWPLFWSGQAQLNWTDGKAGDELELSIPVDAAGKYSFIAQFTRTPYSGVIQLYLDDLKFGGPLELFSPTAPVPPGKSMEPGTYEFDQKYGFTLRKNERPTGPLFIGDLELGKGDHMLRIEIVKNSPDRDVRNRVGLDYVKLEMQR